ncbi:hypothetical protein FCG40_07785 [Fimbriimonadia bacterium ATM]|nr:hypothetical protein [Fimbriimonadia bacterium ATM]
MVSASIGVPNAVGLSNDATTIAAFVAEKVREAMRAVIDRAESGGIAVEEDALFHDLEMALDHFERRAASSRKRK